MDAREHHNISSSSVFVTSVKKIILRSDTFISCLYSQGRDEEESEATCRQPSQSPWVPNICHSRGRGHAWSRRLWVLYWVPQYQRWGMSVYAFFHCVLCTFSYYIYVLSELFSACAYNHVHMWLSMIHYCEIIITCLTFYFVYFMGRAFNGYSL